MRVQNYKYCWIVDPLDGTKEFIKRVPHFTVNIALVCGSAPIMGVVYTPAANTSHFAIKGRGAYVRCASMHAQHAYTVPSVPPRRGGGGRSAHPRWFRAGCGHAASGQPSAACGRQRARRCVAGRALGDT